MKWDDYQNFINDLTFKYNTNREKTDVECPKCGSPLWRRTDIVLASYPPQHKYECDACGWKGTGY